ncbi:membrane-associated protein [Frondihabitans sp. PhB188]|uniref:DedA family protein n=1 Tax=Frondihabitans sp. PhB188 TaxID=2485200 RepID=UPI000F4A0C42|nr:VTT domain-containing protein [Frondihabitans sp. PhB188]ROQ38393.1 membrane-associated protein [Frondihabitans sp. PhB188]
MLPLAAIPFLDPEALIHAFGPWAVLGICAIIFAETGLLIGFIFPGDTLLILAGVIAAKDSYGLGMPIVLIAFFIAIAAFLGGELGYLIGHKVGPRIFERKDSGIFSSENVKKTNQFFERFGSGAVILARFVPVIRTFLPIAAGVAHMRYKKYSLFNAIGAVAWGFGITMIGYGIGHIPPVATFVENYIDIILLGAVVLTVVPVLVKVLSTSRKAKKAEAESSTPANGEARTQP